MSKKSRCETLKKKKSQNVCKLIHTNSSKGEKSAVYMVFNYK